MDKTAERIRAAILEEIICEERMREKYRKWITPPAGVFAIETAARMEAGSAQRTEGLYTALIVSGLCGSYAEITEALEMRRKGRA